VNLYCTDITGQDATYSEFGLAIFLTILKAVAPMLGDRLEYICRTQLEKGHMRVTGTGQKIVLEFKLASGTWKTFMLNTTTGSIANIAFVETELIIALERPSQNSIDCGVANRAGEHAWVRPTGTKDCLTKNAGDDGFLMTQGTMRLPKILKQQNVYDLKLDDFYRGTFESAMGIFCNHVCAVGYKARYDIVRLFTKVVNKAIPCSEGDASLWRDYAIGVGDTIKAWLDNSDDGNATCMAYLKRRYQETAHANCLPEILNFLHLYSRSSGSFLKARTTEIEIQLIDCVYANAL